MKKLFLACLILLPRLALADGYASTPSRALTYMNAGLTPAQQQRASIVPARVFMGWGLDRVTYQIVTAPHSAPSSPLPASVIRYGTETCYTKEYALPEWRTKNFMTHAEAKWFYSSLPEVLRNTAYLLATAATNSPFIVVHQEGRGLGACY